jgi:hypothetical protein
MKTVKNFFVKNQIFVLTLSLLLVASFAQAQDSEKMQTLFSGKSKITGFGSVIHQLTFANNARVRSFYSIGAEGGILFNRRLYVGLYGLTSLAPNDINSLENGAVSTNKNLRLIQTGGVIGYKFFPTKMVHLNFNTKIGGAFLVEDNYTYRSNYDAQVSQPFFMVNPTLNIEVNLFSWMQIFVGGGYNLMSGNEVFGIKPTQDLSAATFQLGFSFGRF